MMNPHSTPSIGFSAMNQAIAMSDRNATFPPHGTSGEASHSGRRDSHGLNVKRSKGLRASESTRRGRTRFRAKTPTATHANTFGRNQRALPTPRATRVTTFTG